MSEEEAKNPVPAERGAIAGTRVRGAGHRAVEARAQSTRRASHWVLAVAILQTVLGLVLAREADHAADLRLARLAELAGDEGATEFVLDNEIVRVGDLRADIELDRLVGYGPLALGVAFFLLWIWSRKAPLPALATALVLFVVLAVASIARNPGLLLDGLYFQGFCIVGLLGGVRSAREARRIESELARRAEA